MAKFNIQHWDWKEQPDFELIDGVLESINQQVRIRQIDTGGDYYNIIIHTLDLSLTDKQWDQLEGAIIEEDFPDHSTEVEKFYHVDLKELKKYLADRQKRLKKEDEEYEKGEIPQEIKKTEEQIEQLRVKLQQLRVDNLNQQLTQKGE